VDLEEPVTVSLLGPEGKELGGVARKVATGPEWRRRIAQFRAPADTAGVRLAIAARGVGSLWLDDVSVLEEDPPVEPEREPLPPAPGNRLHNGSFELGADGWTPAEQVHPKPGPAPAGDRFARWIPAGLPLAGRPFAAREDQEYSFSAMLRNPQRGAKVTLALVELGGGRRFEQTVELSTEWRRYVLSARLTCEERSRFFPAFAAGERLHQMDLDAVQVQEGPATDYRPASPAEIGHSLTRSQLFPRPDDLLVFSARIYAPAGVPEGTTLTSTVEGFYGEHLGGGDQPVMVSGPLQDVPVRVRVPSAGLQKLTLSLRAGARLLGTTEVMLAALPPAPVSMRAESFFGGHGSLGTAGEWHAPSVAARAGIRWWRLHNSSAYLEWAVVQPARGQFVWYDREIDLLRAKGMSLLGVLTRTPPWAGKDPAVEPTPPRTTWPPARTADYAAFGRAVAEHFRGRVAAYEVWSEPWDPSSFFGSAQRYMEIAQAAAAAVRNSDPQAMVVGGSLWAGAPEFIEKLRSGGFNTVVDRPSLQAYVRPEDLSTEGSSSAPLSADLRGVQARLQGAGARSRMWTTEGAVACPSFYSWAGSAGAARVAARALAKALILNKAAGVERFFYYPVWLENGDSRRLDLAPRENWSLLDVDGSAKPTLAALAACAGELDGADPAGRVETSAVRAYVFGGKKQSVVALWAPGAIDGPRTLALPLSPRSIELFNLMGNPWPVRSTESGASLTLRDEPAYLRVRGTAPRVLLAMLKQALGVQVDRPVARR
jgi:hypothetical protein